MINPDLGIGSVVKHPEFGTGVIIQVRSGMYEIVFIDSGMRQISKQYDGLEVIHAQEEERNLISYDKMERIFTKMLRELTDIQETVPMAKKWQGGRIILEPGDQTLSGKDMPIDIFFHKIVMARDRLRTLEQRLNASELNDLDKVAMQQYITKIYGSLTSFNVLFADKGDYFIGEKANN